MMREQPELATFDAFAGDYDAALHQGLSVSGENKHFFARGRIDWLARCLQAHRLTSNLIVDFGCGTGTSVPFLFELLKPKKVIGLDVSEQSLDVARQCAGSLPAQFFTCDEYVPDGSADLVFCNGVFHHIPPEQRPSAICSLYNMLRPGGCLALWENNPLNPGTRYVMSKIPFDRDAITLTSRETRSLLRAGGFRILQTDYLFIFPRLLRIFRIFESLLTQLPFGAQYQVLARKECL